MTRVLPRYIKEFIERRMPAVVKQANDPSIRLSVPSGYASLLPGLVILVEQIPPELLPVDPREYVNLTTEISRIKYYSEKAQQSTVGLSRMMVQEGIVP